MIFIGGTNHGRKDGGLPPEGASHYRLPTINVAGRRTSFHELYIRGERYWLHASLDTPEKIAEAIRQYEQALAEKRPRHERGKASNQ